MAGDIDATTAKPLEVIYGAANVPDPQSSTSDFVLTITADATTPNRFTIAVSLGGVDLATGEAEAIN